eukprot:8227428-Ditylum_brightwellii.AAC.1
MSPMVFAANQQQNETYIFKDMLQHHDAKSFIMAMLDKMQVCGKQGHWTLMKPNDVTMDKCVNSKVKQPFWFGVSKGSNFLLVCYLDTKLDFAHMVACSNGV